VVVYERAEPVTFWPGAGIWPQRIAMSTYVPPITTTFGLLPGLVSIVLVFLRTSSSYILLNFENPV
jgi:hypothetical protein